MFGTGSISSQQLSGRCYKQREEDERRERGQMEVGSDRTALARAWLRRRETLALFAAILDATDAQAPST